MKEIIIYTNETCPYCKQIKEELTKNNIEFEDRLTNKFEDEWNKINTLTGLPNVPTIVYKNNHFAPGRDYRNAQHLADILKNFKENDYSIEKQLFEKVKTLNYNIHAAFSRLDHMLKQIEIKLNTEDEHKSND